MVWAGLHNVQNLVNIVVSVVSDQSEWSKQFSSQQSSLLLLSKVLKWHVNCSWLIRTVAIWNRVVLQWVAAPEQFGAI